MNRHKPHEKIRLPERSIHTFVYPLADEETTGEWVEPSVTGYFIPNNSLYSVKEKRLYIDTNIDSKYLTFRQIQILYGIIKGYNRSELSNRLFIGVKTVEFHCERIKIVLDQPSKSKLIAFVIESGLAFAIIEVIETLSPRTTL